MRYREPVRADDLEFLEEGFLQFRDEPVTVPVRITDVTESQVSLLKLTGDDFEQARCDLDLLDCNVAWRLFEDEPTAADLRDAPWRNPALEDVGWMGTGD